MATPDTPADRDEERDPLRNRSGKDDDHAVDPLTDDDDDEADAETHQRQEDLLDEGIEETFPASDPVSVKHIT